MTRTISRTAEKKNGRTWIETFQTTDEKEVYDSLAHDMIAKKINGCTWIKSIKRTPNYDGTQTITVTYDNNCRSIYIVSDH